MPALDYLFRQFARFSRAEQAARTTEQPNK